MLFVDYANNHDLIYIKKGIVFTKEEGIGKICSLSPNEHMTLIGLSVYCKIGRDDIIISPKDIYKALTNEHYNTNERRLGNAIIEGLKGLHDKNIIELGCHDKLTMTKELTIDLSKIKLTNSSNDDYYALHFKEVERIMNHNTNVNRANLLLLFAIVIDALSLHDNRNKQHTFRTWVMEDGQILGDHVDYFKGIYSWYSQLKLSKMIGVDIRTIRDYLDILKDLKLIYMYSFAPYCDDDTGKFKNPPSWICRYQHKDIINELASVKVAQREYAIQFKNS